MPSCFLVFPTHLYENDIVVQNASSWDDVYVIEEPLFFYDSKERPYKTHKLKIAYMRACMKNYVDYLKPHLKNVHYIDWNQAKTFKTSSFTQVHCYDPLDVILEARLKKTYPNITIHRELPNFIASSKDVDVYGKRRTFSHKTFYDLMKNKLDILQNTPNYDQENREQLPSSVQPPIPLKFRNTHYQEAIDYVCRHSQFKNHPGTCSFDTLSSYPCTFKDAQANLEFFIKHRLHSFGMYQDAIHDQHSFLFHSNLSSQLNVGILTPHQIVKIVYRHQKNTAMNNIEGFLRQVIGWREYMRFIYTMRNEHTLPTNHWKATQKLRWDVWYGRQTTAIDPLTTEIKKCIEYGYAHHIVRLMVFLNIMVLCDVHPQQIIKWFMECCAIDAYTWIMHGNIYAMGWYDTRFMKKPYISTSRYMLTMSNYKKGSWCKEWDALFYVFLHRHQQDLIRTSKVYLRNLRYFEKKDPKEQASIIQTAHRAMMQLVGE
jgi:deoxyribodipyrimidine photolyase-related protein